MAHALLGVGSKLILFGKDPCHNRRLKVFIFFVFCVDSSADRQNAVLCQWDFLLEKSWIWMR